MTTKDCFSFRFVDRDAETNALKAALSDTSCIPILYGVHGAGKTRFVKEFCETEYTDNYIYIELMEEQSSLGSIDRILTQIQNDVHKDFMEYLKTTLKTIVKVLGKQTIDIHGIKTGVDFTSFAEIINPESRYEIGDKEVNASYLLNKYLKSLQRKLIIIDNFHLCDQNAFTILLDVFKELIVSSDDGGCRIVLSITETENNRAYRKLKEEINIHSIRLNEFDQCNLFFMILRGLFDIDEYDRPLIEDIFSYCGGNPRRLKEFLHILEEKGIMYLMDSSEKAQIKKEEVQIVLKDRFEYTAFILFPPMERCIISAITCFGEVLSGDNLQALSEYLYKCINRSKEPSNSEYIESLMALERLGIISPITKNNIVFWSMDHDLVFEFYKDEAEKNPFFHGIHGYMAEFTSQNQESLHKQGINELTLNAIYARHAHEGRCTNWESSVYNIGIRYLSTGNYVLAAKYFEKLDDSNYPTFFNNEKYLTIAECMYFACEYQESEKYLKKLGAEGANSFRYWHLKTKLDKVFLRQSEAESSVVKLLDFTNCGSDNYILALSMAERVFLNSPNKRKDAITYHNKILEYESDSSLEHIVGRCLKTSIEYFRGEKAQKALEKAAVIAKKHGDCYDLGAIHTNRGFDFFWQGKITEAKDEFIKARDILREVCPAEMSYPLNNLANCHMIEGHFLSAMETFNLALLWNHSEYVSITTKALLLLCQAINGEDMARMKTEISKMEAIADDSSSDISIRIKVNYILSRIHIICEDSIQAKALKDKAFAIAHEHDQLYLPYIWIPNYSDDIDKDMRTRVPPEKYPQMYKFEIDPWLVTLSHE